MFQYAARLQQPDPEVLNFYEFMGISSHSSSVKYLRSKALVAGFRRFDALREQPVAVLGARYGMAWGGGDNTLIAGIDRLEPPPSEPRAPALALQSYASPNWLPKMHSLRGQSAGLLEVDFFGPLFQNQGCGESLAESLFVKEGSKD